MERAELDRGRRAVPGLSRPPQLDTPDPGLNAAFAWAAGQRPGSVRAEGGSGLPEWGDLEFEHLRLEGKAFRRVGPGAIRDPGAFLVEIVSGLFGARRDQEGGRSVLSPWLVEGWRRMALRRLRLHRTVVDVEVRPRAEWVTVRLEVGFGPSVPLAVSLRNCGPVGRITVDEVALEGERAIFTLLGEHEVNFFLTGRTP